MGNLLKKIGNTLTPIIFVIIVLMSFIGFTNKSITKNDLDKLEEQIKYNEDHKKPALTVDGVKADGTKMTDEEYQIYLDEQAKVVDIDIITPVVTKEVNKINLSINNTIIISICMGIGLTLLGVGLFKVISKISGGIFIGDILSIGLTFNLSRYIKMGDISNICKEHILFLIICLVIYIISKFGNSIKTKFLFRKEEKQTEEKIKSRLKQNQDLEDEILDVRIKSNDPIFVVATREDSTVTTVKEQKINDLDEDTEKLKELAFNDSLTGLFNRTAFLKDIENKKVNNAGIIMLDVNNLKRTNDTYGHTEGDRLIIYAADYIRLVFGKFGKCYRLGGDEFTVLIKNIKDEALIYQAMENLNPLLEKNNTLPFPVVIASGFASFNPETDKNLNDTFNRADELMYENKKKIKEKDSLKTRKDDENKEENKLNEELNNSQEIENKEKNDIETKEQAKDIVEEPVILEQESKNNTQEEKMEQEEINTFSPGFKSEENTTQEKVSAEEQEEINNNIPVQNTETKSNYDENDEDFSIKISEDLKNKDYYKETYIQRIDGTVEKVENNSNDTDYDAIRRYLDSKKEENNNQNEIKNNEENKSEDLPFANYNPEVDSPYKFESATTILDKEMEKVEIEKTDNIEEDDS